jgi:hypothetical protein
MNPEGKWGEKFQDEGLVSSKHFGMILRILKIDTGRHAMLE